MQIDFAGRRRRRAIALAALLALAAIGWRGETATASLPAWLAPITQTSEPFIGVTYYQITQSLNSPAPYILPREVSLHIVEIDPTAPGISFLGSPGNGTAEYEYARKTTSAFVTANDLAVGINGDFYTTDTGVNANVNGLGMSNGTVVSAAASGTYSLITRQNNAASIVNGSMPSYAWNAVSGNQRIVTNGVNTAPDNSYTNTLNPHTAAGVGADGHVYFMVVDGRQGNFSEGMYTSEMADIFIDFGVRNAINLDGGGSSTLVFADGRNGTARTVNSPSDGSSEQSPGSQRSVANHFGVYATPNPAYVALASPPRPGAPTADPILKTLTVLDSFDGGEGRFATAPTYSGSNRGLAAVTADYSTETAQTGPGSEKITITRNGDAEGKLRFLSGTGSPTYNRVDVGGQQQAMGKTGYVGLFLKTTDPGLQISLGLDDGYRTGTTGLELSYGKTVIADGKWRLYEWNLADASHWDSFSGGNGAIDGPNAYLDSVFVTGGAATANQTFTLFMDTVAYNPAGSLASLVATYDAADFNQDGSVDNDDLAIWKQGFGVDARGDADGDNDTDGADYLRWQRQLGASSAAGAALSVPEPSAGWSAAVGAAGLCRRLRTAAKPRRRAARCHSR